MKYSLTGKALLATYENPNTIQSLGINIQRFVLPYLIVLFIIGLGIAFININENILRPNDLVFYLLK
ncbi:MAG: hypothetical protein H6767_02035 [Candidatus Peribacteria bacterium]|nr:MAG: hypothetical protein H6767_02035 [Candidatus Peribacteria bacterium]